MVFQPFWSEIAYRFESFWSESLNTGMDFGATGKEKGTAKLHILV